MADSYELKIGQGTLFKNDKKTQDNHPDYTGKVNIDGTMKRLAAWIKQAKSGMAYFSIQISDFKEQDTPVQAPVEDPINPPASSPKIKPRKSAPVEDAQASDDLPF